VDAIARAPPVDLELGLAGALAADAAGEARQARGLLGQARQHVLELRQLDLQLAVLGGSRRAKMSRMSWVRSSTLRSVVSVMARSCDGDRSRSNTSVSAPSSSACSASSSTLPEPTTVRGSSSRRIWMTESITLTPAVRASCCSSPIDSSARARAPRPAGHTPTSSAEARTISRASPAKRRDISASCSRTRAIASSGRSCTVAKLSTCGVSVRLWPSVSR
jgi:hypothetical protein